MYWVPVMTKPFILGSHFILKQIYGVDILTAFLWMEQSNVIRLAETGLGFGSKSILLVLKPAFLKEQFTQVNLVGSSSFKR